MLGEPLITKDTWRTDLARMSLTAIRASLSLLYDITATSFDRKSDPETRLTGQSRYYPTYAHSAGESLRGHCAGLS